MDAAFTDLTFNKPGNDDIYPTIGLESVGEHVHVNFGKEPFMFDIMEYMQTSYTRWKGAVDDFAKLV